VIFLQAAVSNRGPVALAAVEADRIELAISDAILREIEEVLNRTDIQYERDPDDEPYLNLAIVSKTEFPVTRDRDLLDLTDENNPDGQRLRAQAPGLQVLDPAAFLQALAAETNSWAERSERQQLIDGPHQIVGLRQNLRFQLGVIADPGIHGRNPLHRGIQMRE
jgi:predicted nucleic acid-binding protein